MTKEEFKKIAATLRIYYPNTPLLSTAFAVDMWYMLLSDISAEKATVAINVWAATKNTPPTIADIRGQANSCVSEPIPDWLDQYNRVRNNIHRYGMYNIDAGLAELDGITRKTVEHIGYMTMCISTEPEKIRNQFRRIYETLATRAMHDSTIPEGLRKAMESLRKKESRTMNNSGME